MNWFDIVLVVVFGLSMLYGTYRYGTGEPSGKIEYPEYWATMLLYAFLISGVVLFT